MWTIMLENHNATVRSITAPALGSALLNCAKDTMRRNALEYRRALARDQINDAKRWLILARYGRALILEIKTAKPIPTDISRGTDECIRKMAEP